MPTSYQDKDTHIQRLEAAISSADLGLWDIIIKKDEYYTNDLWWQMLGYHREDASNNFDFFFKIVHPDDKKLIEKTLNELSPKGKDTFDLTIRLKHKDGEFRYIEVRGQVLEWEDDRAIRASGTHMDITDRLLLKEQNETNKLRLEAAILGADLGVWDTHLKTGMNFANDKWWQMLGYETDEVDNLYELFYELVHPDDAERVNEEIASLQKGIKERFDVLIKIRHKKGHYIYLRDQAKGVEWNKKGEAVRLVGTHLDVTENYVMTEQLRFHDERLESAIRGADLGVWDSNIKTGMNYANDRWWQMFGYRPNQVENSFDFFFEIAHPDDSKLILDSIDQLRIDGKKDFDLLVRVKHKDGRYRFIQDRGHVVEWEDGKALRLIGTHLDVTENQELTQKLKFNEARLAAAINGADLGVWDLDVESGIQITNDRWWEMLGYTTFENESKFDVVLTLIHPDDFGIIAKVTKDLESGKTKGIDIVVRLKHKLGHYITILDRGSVIEWTEDGKPKRMIGTILDITDQINYEKQLSSALEERNNILEATDNGFVSLDAKQNVTYLNSTAQEILNITSTELTKNSFLELFDPVLRSKLEMTIKKLNLSRKSQSFEIRDRSQKRWLNFSLYLNKEGYGVFIQDITESKMIHEENLESSIRAMENERNRIAKELHDGVLQEMTAAMMFADNLKDKITDETNVEKLQGLADILKKTTNDTRRISHDLSVPDLEKEKLSKLLSRLVNNLDLASQVKFEFIEIDDLETIKIDDNLKINTYRIVQELFVNIIKHSGASKASLKIFIESGTLNLEIRDNGKGLNSESHKGMGIGLKNISERLQKIDGTIQMENASNGGLFTKIKILT